MSEVEFYQNCWFSKGCTQYDTSSIYSARGIPVLMPKRNVFIWFQIENFLNFLLSMKMTVPVFVNVAIDDSGLKSSDDLSYASKYRHMHNS
jgi:hypothetical protein